MKHHVFVLLVIVFTSCHFAPPLAAADNEVQAVIDKAITAHGGAERLSKFTAEITKAKGTLYVGGRFPFTQEVQLQLPDQYKDTTILSFGDQQAPVILVMNGEQGWVRSGDETKEMDARIRTETKEGLHLARLTRLVALKEKGLELQALGPVKLDGREAFGIKVISKDYRDVALFFDKETGLILKIARVAYDFDVKKEVPEERIFNDYGEVEGIRVARKFAVFRDGKRFMDVEVVEAKLPGKLGVEVFAKP